MHTLSLSQQEQIICALLKVALDLLAPAFVAQEHHAGRALSRLNKCRRCDLRRKGGRICIGILGPIAALFTSSAWYFKARWLIFSSLYLTVFER